MCLLSVLVFLTAVASGVGFTDISLSSRLWSFWFNRCNSDGNFLIIYWITHSLHSKGDKRYENGSHGGNKSDRININLVNLQRNLFSMFAHRLFLWFAVTRVEYHKKSFYSVCSSIPKHRFLHFSRRAYAVLEIIIILQFMRWVWLFLNSSSIGSLNFKRGGLTQHH